MADIEASVSTISTAPDRYGSLIDFHLDDLPEVTGPKGMEWRREHLSRALFGSDEVLRASKPPEDGVTDAPGIYFLIWDGLICYVGKASRIHTRIESHLKEGRPIDRVATICGLPKWAQSGIEYAYITAWEPSWNADMRCPYAYYLPELEEELKTKNREHVMPRYVPRVDQNSLFWPEWRLQILGREQSRSNDLHNRMG